jgi:hypothetical protein
MPVVARIARNNVQRGPPCMKDPAAPVLPALTRHEEKSRSDFSSWTSYRSPLMALRRRIRLANTSSPMNSAISTIGISHQ